MTQRQYIEYLIATTENYTCSNLAAHLEGEAAQSHDAVCDFLSREKLTPRGLWTVAQKVLNDGPDSYLIFDDSVQDKRYSSKIELVKLQYSGAEGGLVRGIGVLNLLHSSGQDGEFCPLDYRIYAPECDGKSKNEHFREMLIRAVCDKELQAQTVLFDSWYASLDNLRLIERLQLSFVTTLKSNRLVSVWSEREEVAPDDEKSPEKALWVHLQELEWNAQALREGILVKLKSLGFAVRVFKIVATNGDIEWLLTNGSHTGRAERSPRLTAHDVKSKNAVRWHIEQLHRELKQLVGSAKCQCRKARSQRNHLACCYLAWVAIKQRARQIQTTAYQAKRKLWSDFLKHQLANPTITACPD
ncbi:hypothetical protein IAD21_00827 [Abditibacteriota bacterium]|nr:hypothetical protein IAD21_00827 [Abditibacteriota bacterium]